MHTTSPSRREAATNAGKRRDAGFAAFLFLFGAYGLRVDHLHRQGEDAAGLHLHHVPTPIMCAAMICASLIWLASLADDYEINGVGVASNPSVIVGKCVGLSLLGAALVFPLIG